MEFMQYFRSIFRAAKSLWIWLRHGAYPSFVQFGKRFGWWKLSLILGILVGGGSVLWMRGLPHSEEVAQKAPRTVEIRSISDISAEAVPLSVVGTVSSQTQADIRTESGGEVVGVYKSLGDRVLAGEIIAELENASQRAAVQQAQGSLAAAQAQLTKANRGSRDEQQAILQANLASAKSNLAAAKDGAVNAILSAYSSVDETVRRKADPMFNNPDTASPKFLIQTTESQLATDAESTRINLGAILIRESAANQTFTAGDDLTAEFTRADADLKFVRSFLDKVIGALNKAVPNQSVSDATIATYKSDTNTARGTITSAITSLTTAKTALAGTVTSVEVAQKNLEQGSAGDSSDIAAAQANVTQAQGALAAARAGLEKTIVRSPISGTINALPLSRGDFVSSFAPAVTVANNNALEVRTYVTEAEAPALAVGSEVTFEGGHKGVITHIAPAIDTATKKVEVRIGVPDPKGLVNGQAITINFNRAVHTTTSAALAQIIIPIAALKIASDTMMVFTVDENNKLVAHTVTIGTLLGDKVVIVDGITPSTQIVLDARGLKEGDTVTIKGL